MHFSVAAATVLALFAAVSARPMPRNQLTRRCDVGSCAIALGPAGVGCTAAAVEVGANPIADAGCVAGALNGLVNTPAACDGCAGGLLDPVTDAIGGAVDSVEDAFGSIF